MNSGGGGRGASLELFPCAATMNLGCVEAELSCVKSWFIGWTPHQRGKFMEELLCKAVPGNSADLLLDSLSGMSIQNNSMGGPSIFQCQLKLFRHWFDHWQDKEKSQLLASLQEVDSDFVVQFQESVDRAQNAGIS